MLICLLGLTLFTTGSALATVSIDYQPYNNALIKFFGATDTFSFTQPAGGNFLITNVTGGTDPQTLGLTGNISGTFTIGAITTVGPLQTAPVTGTGLFTIKDEANVTFTASLAWVDISTFFGAGGINSGGVANLMPVSYGGANTDLLAFFNNGGTTNLTFNFSPGKTLTNLTTGVATNSTTFSGSASAVPVPGALGLMATGLIGVVGLGLRKKS